MKFLTNPLPFVFKLFIFSVAIIAFFSLNKTDVFGKEITAGRYFDSGSLIMKMSIPSLTQTLFQTKTITVSSVLPYSSETENSADLEIGTSEVKQKGVNGTLTETFEVEYYNGEESSRRLASQQRTEPQMEIIVKGTKIIWRSEVIDETLLSYWKKLTVYATPYTAASAGKPANSPGFGITATGTRAHFGTVAVDPGVIPLGTKMYIPGYGYGVAEDTGGAIKGNKIDLFYEGNHGWWNSHSVDIYLLN